ncbi:uncharacterized protein MEPE_04006 [Melanopsichium pennsylvanicum]|uniref:Uncharacterized protein n=2 Tax=Melanopsichium pennsylvanicum TaxID=63383 RepID=A0AAJ4XN52_9BASI|nr:uncharacterized protein MEPE_04006 [Melanopsichium pennsylvanicum]
MYAHALRTRLQFASFKALNGVGKTSLSELTSSPSIQPLTPSLVENNQPEASDPSQATTPALSQGESLPSSSQSSARSMRSMYLDIFGTDFCSTPSSSKSLSRASSSATTSTPSKRPSTLSTSTRSLLDKAASSPQLGSPERKNGRFDWHNNPTSAMVANETKLAEESFALPTGSPSKRRREASHNLTSNLLFNTPKRSRMQSSGFLPNGHPASSLAQDLGLTTPRAPRSRHASGRHVFAIQQQTIEQDQAERDRVANTLAALADARHASSGSDSSSGSDRPHTPPPTSRRTALGLGFASPTIQRGGGAFAQPAAANRSHRRNVSSGKLPADLHVVDAHKKEVHEDGEDRAAADYLLFLAHSPSPSSIKRFSGDAETVGSNGILSTPAQTSLWDPFTTDPLSNTGGRRGHLQSSAGNAPRYSNLSSTPLTPPPTNRKVSKASTQMAGLGFDADTLSSSQPTTPSKPAANAKEYMMRSTPRSPRTPPPSTHLSSRNNSATFDSGFFPTTPPNAPGAPGGDTTFHYADFVNVSPSPQPPSTGKFPGASGYLGNAHLTPTKTNRFRFDPRHT